MPINVNSSNVSAFRNIISLCCLVLACAAYLFSPDFFWWQSDIERHIALNLKLPVLLTAILVGASVSCSAAALQVVLRNPLADPGLIGISSGASLVAAVLIMTGALTSLDTHAWSFNIPQHYLLAMACFIGALASALLIMTLAKRMLNTQSAIILMGIGISTIAGAIIAWLYLIAPPSAIKDMTFWLMGSLHNTDYYMLVSLFPIVLAAFVFLFKSAYKLNWLYMDVTTAKLNGLDVTKFERNILIASALLVGISVSLAGSIAFLGLHVPHFVRAVFGYDNRNVVFLSGVFGATVMVITAVINELLFTSIVPVSMLTATIGGPLFIYALLKQKH